jgi:probable HAF family extracellular repeat protein
MKSKPFCIILCTLLIITVLPDIGANKIKLKIENQEIIEKRSDDEYTIIDLGTLGGSWSYATGFNDECYIVGISATNNGVQHAFVWICNSMYDMGAPEGFVVSGAVNVNNHGQVVGYANGAYQSQYAYFWEEGNWTYLGTLPDLDWSTPSDINDEGQITGNSFILGPGGGRRGWFYEDGDMTDIGHLGGNRSSAYAINEIGQVVGSSYNETNVNHAILWEDGNMTDLGVLPGEERSAAYDINENGVVCGASSHTLNQYPFPTFTTACVWDGEEIIEIDKLPGYTRNNAAGGINNQDQVVGYSSDNGNNPHAFIWEDGELTDLNDLLPSGSGWVLKTAADINDDGEIIGYGKINGETHGYLLIPPYINQKPVFSDESPGNGSTDVSISTTSLSLKIEDFEADSFNWSIETSPNIGSSSGFDEYNGTKSCSVSGLDYDTTYTWYVNSTDSGSGKWTMEVYTFTTEEENNPPNTPSNPDPADEETDVDVNAVLSWTCSDPDGDPLTYDVYFGTSNPPPKVVSNQSDTSYHPGTTMDYETVYYWQIVAWDDNSANNIGPIWKFTTESEPLLRPDLKCEGEFEWYDVRPESTISDSFTVENVGDANSELSWEVTEYPSWGSQWTFEPSSGTGLTPEEGPITVIVHVVAPPHKESMFEGFIKVENTENSSDFEIISVSLTTPRNRAILKPLLYRFFERFPDLFPILRHLLLIC